MAEGSYKERSFYDWLGEQRTRPDDIGKFAKGVWADVHFPRALASEKDLVGYMEKRGAHEDAVETAREAWEEYGDSATEYTPSDQMVDWDDDDEDE